MAYFGNPEEELLTAVKKSASIYNVALNELSREESESKFPQFSIPSNYEVVFEAEAGFLTPEKSILTMAHLATQNGADIRTRTAVHLAPHAGRYATSNPLERPLSLGNQVEKHPVGQDDPIELQAIAR